METTERISYEEYKKNAKLRRRGKPVEHLNIEKGDKLEYAYREAKESIPLDILFAFAFGLIGGIICALLPGIVGCVFYFLSKAPTVGTVFLWIAAGVFVIAFISLMWAFYKGSSEELEKAKKELEEYKMNNE